MGDCCSAQRMATGRLATALALATICTLAVWVIVDEDANAAVKVPVAAVIPTMAGTARPRPVLERPCFQRECDTVNGHTVCRTTRQGCGPLPAWTSPFFREEPHEVGFETPIRVFEHAFERPDDHELMGAGIWKKATEGDKVEMQHVKPPDKSAMPLKVQAQPVVQKVSSADADKIIKSMIPQIEKAVAHAAKEAKEAKEVKQGGNKQGGNKQAQGEKDDRDQDRKALEKAFEDAAREARHDESQRTQSSQAKGDAGQEDGRDQKKDDPFGVAGA